MTKINLDTAQNINIIAKRGDDFNLSLTIDDENGFPIVFNNSDSIELGNPYRDVLLFTITDANNSPVLIACSESLHIGSGNDYVQEATSNEINYAQAVAKIVANYAGRNNGDAQNNYGTEIPGIFTFNLVDTIVTKTDDKDNSIFNKTYTGYMVKGTIISTDNKTQSITFKNNDFKLQPGNYKYTFRKLNNLRFQLMLVLILTVMYLEVSKLI